MGDLQFFCTESRVEDNQNIYGQFKLSPFLPGQAVTLLNGLRRCLLSEVSGIAITAIRIKGVTHEYSTLVGLRESVLDVLLNVKQVVLTSELQFEQPQVAYLRVQGPGIVRASDIKLPMSIQNVKPEQYIATLLYDGVLDIKFMICRGKNSLVQTPRGLRTPQVLKTKSPHQINALRNEEKNIKFNTFVNQNINTPDLRKDKRWLFITAPHVFLKQKHKKKIKTYANLIILRLMTEAERIEKAKKTKLPMPKNSVCRYPVQKKEIERLHATIVLEDVDKVFLDTAFLPIDAVFAPVLRVNFAIEENDLSNAPKECVILDILTNGSVHPTEAIVEAGKALTNITGLLKPNTFSKPVFINSLKSFNKALAYNKILKQKEEELKSFKKGIIGMFDNHFDKILEDLIRSLTKNQLDQVNQKKLLCQLLTAKYRPHMLKDDKLINLERRVINALIGATQAAAKARASYLSLLKEKENIPRGYFPSYLRTYRRYEEMKLELEKRRLKFKETEKIKSKVEKLSNSLDFVKQEAKSSFENHFLEMKTFLSFLSVPEKKSLDYFSVDISNLGLSLR